MSDMSAKNMIMCSVENNARRRTKTILHPFYCQKAVMEMSEEAKNTENAEKETDEKTVISVPFKLAGAVLTGRRVIYTDETEITLKNIAKIINDTMPVHEENREEIRMLNCYEKGDQPVFYRVKDIRPEINVKANANYATQIKTFKVGYEFGSPITFVQRGKQDYRKSDSTQDDLRIAKLNEMFFEQKKQSKDVKLAEDFKVGGLGYMMAYPKKKKKGISPFDLIVLNPMNTYVIRYNDAYQEKAAAVTYIPKKDGSKKITVYTDEWIFEGESFTGKYRKTANQIGIIPIVEFVNNYNRQGCFETVIPLMDALNITNSDRVNDVVQYVQSILWLHNCKVDEDQKQELVNGGFIQTKTTADGREAKVTYVTSPLNQGEVQTLVDYMYNQILEIAGVPGREASTGGNTGSAILLSNGWQIAETQAKAMELIFGDAETELLEVVLEIIKNTPDMPDDLKTLGLSDVMPKFSRNKTYELTSRVNSMVTMINAGIDPNKAISVVDIFDDSQQVAIDSLERINQILFQKKSEDTTSENLLENTDEKIENPPRDRVRGEE